MATDSASPWSEGESLLMLGLAQEPGQRDTCHHSLLSGVLKLCSVKVQLVNIPGFQAMSFLLEVLSSYCSAKAIIDNK